ncbi:class I SAM-dependent DNA methyltransferase [Streptomyces sp. NPDC020801]|uniref:class I SAM-dependent DNA methyltransferase n=1 Tax=unclassified Streptomyces TaxID=2593676 RepID=UPI003791D28C
MYGAELTDVYELIHQGRGKNYREEAEEVARRVRARAPHAVSLLDVACGTGAHLRHFATLFDHVEGLEISEPMLAAAHDRMPGTTLHAGDMRTFAVNRAFDVITCMFGAIGYTTTQAELAATLRRFARHLNPGGTVAVDPWWFAENYAEGHVSGDVVTVDGRTVARVSHSAREDGACRMEVHYIVADAVAGVRHFAESHRISLFTRQQYQTAFAAAGFDVDYVAGLNAGRGLFIGSLRPPRRPVTAGHHVHEE